MLCATRKERAWNVCYAQSQRRQRSTKQKIKLRNAPPLTFQTSPPIKALHKLIHAVNILKTNMSRRIKYVPIRKNTRKSIIVVKFDATNRRLCSIAKLKRTFKNVPPAPLKWRLWSHQTRSQIFITF